MRYLTISQAAERLQLSVPTIKRYIYDGALASTKLPGGQHRIPESEVERLLAGDGEPPQGGDAGDAAGVEVTPETRLEVLERWATDLEAEVERLSNALAVISRYCADVRPAEEDATMPRPQPRGSIQVLGPGCRRCHALHELVVQVAAAMGLADVEVRHVTDLGEIIAFGPVVTPGLVINGELVLSGLVPAETELRELLAAHLGPSTPA